MCYPGNCCSGLKQLSALTTPGEIKIHISKQNS